MQKVAIIGAGYSALSLAWDLSQKIDQSLEITVYDLADRAGGMMAGFKEKNWSWSLEEHYHHLFSSDEAFAQFLTELGLRENLLHTQVLSKTRYQGESYRLDSAMSLLRFSKISFLSRLRTGAVLALLKMIPDGTFLEKWSAGKFLRQTMGLEAWQVIWEPLFRSKFGNQAEKINLAWFWARIYPRTPSLGYYSGGFQALADDVVKKLKVAGVKFVWQTEVQKIEQQKTSFKLKIKTQNKKTASKNFDLVINTLPAPLLRKISDLPEAQAKELDGFAAMTLLLRLKKPLLTDGTYWLNINEANWPFVAVVEHDNLIAAKHYNQESLVYLGRYLHADDQNFKKTAKQLYREYLPYLKKLNPEIEDLLIDYRVAKTPFGQPLVGPNHSQHLPVMKTSYPGFYWVSMQHIYPYDRGANQAIVTAKKLFSLIKADLKS
jgi:protoporphyrinogen oxidase